jgi:hypothetical protein
MKVLVIQITMSLMLTKKQKASQTLLTVNFIKQVAWRAQFIIQGSLLYQGLGRVAAQKAH